MRDRVEVVDGSHADPDVLRRALRGADGLLWLIPPSLAGTTNRERYLDFSRPAAEAIRACGVSHVVGISSAGHDWPTSAGILSAAFAMDTEIERTGVAYRALSMPAYMENLLGQADTIREQATFALACDPDRILALVATRDIAAVAAALLTDPSWTGQENVPVFGPDHLTPGQMADVVSDVLNRTVTYTRLGLSDVAAAMTEHGASEGVARDMTEMISAQNAGIYDADQAAATPPRPASAPGVRRCCGPPSSTDDRRIVVAHSDAESAARGTRPCSVPIWARRGRHCLGPGAHRRDPTSSSATRGDHAYPAGFAQPRSIAATMPSANSSGRDRSG